MKAFKKRLEALERISTPKSAPDWAFDYVGSITPERWVLIREAFIYFKQGIVNTDQLKKDEIIFYNRVIDAANDGTIQL